MKTNKKPLAAFAAALLLGGTVAFSFGDTGVVPAPTESANGIWRLEATGVRIIGGYGNNFGIPETERHGGNPRPAPSVQTGEGARS